MIRHRAFYLGDLSRNNFSAPATCRRVVAIGSVSASRGAPGSEQSPVRDVKSGLRRKLLAMARETPDKRTGSNRGWREVLRIFYGNFSEHRVTAIAGGVTYFALLAIFPFIAAIVAIYGLFGDVGALGSHLDQMSSFLPGGAIEIVGDQLKSVVAGGKTSLGFAFFISLALSLWSANAGMKALFDALNIVYGATERRGFFKLNAVSLSFTAGAVIFLLLAVAGVVVLPRVAQYLGMQALAEGVVTIARWPLLLVGIIFVLSVVYRYGPCRDNAQWHWITVGSAVTSVVWLASSMAFSYYAAHFGSYNKTYGSLGAVVGVMTWMWLSAMVVLAGAEIDAILERMDRGTAK
jgi:membrane protein